MKNSKYSQDLPNPDTHFTSPQYHYCKLKYTDGVDVYVDVGSRNRMLGCVKYIRLWPNCGTWPSVECKEAFRKEFPIRHDCLPVAVGRLGDPFTLPLPPHKRRNIIVFFFSVFPVTGDEEWVMLEAIILGHHIVQADILHGPTVHSDLHYCINLHNVSI